MSDKPDKESQTEDASEKRLHESIEKGDVLDNRLAIDLCETCRCSPREAAF